MSPPFTAYLRNLRIASIESVPPPPFAEPFRWLGRIDGEHVPDLWRVDGRWREDGSAHPYDIIGIVIGRNAEGALEVQPYGPAAGLKGKA